MKTKYAVKLLTSPSQTFPCRTHQEALTVARRYSGLCTTRVIVRQTKLERLKEFLSTTAASAWGQERVLFEAHRRGLI